MAFARGACADVLRHFDAGGLGVGVPDEKTEGATGISEVHHQVAGLLSQSRGGRVGGDAEDVDLSGGVLDDEERIQSDQGDRSR
jgi:hypothetical protein